MSSAQDSDSPRADTSDISRVIESTDADAPNGVTSFCIGCGSCAFIDSAYQILKNSDGCFQARQVKTVTSGKVDQVCPFAADSNEDELGKSLFSGTEGIAHNQYLGYYLANHVGFVKTSGYRERGSSGGFVSWLASTMLKDGLVDAVIHVKDGPSPDQMYTYQISHTPEEVSQGAKSKYYPIEISHVLRYISEHEGRYLFIGIPCFVKAIRLISRIDPIIKERVIYCVGLVCGHLKSDFFAKSEAWESGIPPSSLRDVDFRYKLPDSSADDYAVKVTSTDPLQPPVIKRVSELSTTNWGLGYFKYNACDFCDDVLAETADITFGDAWLPKYSQDGLGSNVVVIRNPTLKSLFDRHHEELQLFESTPEEIYQSQAGGFRHRRQGLQYRLQVKQQRGEWTPTKRVEPSVDGISNRRQKVYAMRTKLKNESFVAYKEAVQADDFSEFKRHMAPIEKRYQRLSTPFKSRLKRKLIGLIPPSLKKAIKRVLHI